VSASAQATIDVSGDASRAAEPGYARILLATEGRAITDAAIARVVELADREGSVEPGVHVFAIARMHGVAFGLPNPGLLPTKRELTALRAIVDSAIGRLERAGIDAEGHVLATRKVTARICEEATKEECQAIVMAADRARNRIVSDMLWTQEPQRVRRRATVPVFLVLGED
jgi:nucleotide-binding universal stress UspA family protein